MYTIDERDRVVQISEFPQCDAGAPMPVVMCNDYRLVLSYYVHWKLADPGKEPVAVVKFANYYAVMFGPPNDEAFHGHPLAQRGLQPYGAYRVSYSSWIRTLERMNAIHPMHDPKRFEKFTHYILGFHDSTFECIAEGYTVAIVNRHDRAAEMVRRLDA
jgi:hypothetical protein